MGKSIVLSFSNGLGNFILLSPTIAALQDNGWDVDILLGSHSSDARRKELEIIINSYDRSIGFYDKFKKYDEAFYVWGEPREVPEDIHWKINKEAKKPVKYFLDGMHEVQLNFKIAEYLGADNQSISKLYCPKNVFSDGRFDSRKINVGIHIGSRPEIWWQKKRWNNQYWIDLMAMMTESYQNIDFHLFASEWEKDDCDVIFKKSKSSIHTYSHLNLTEVAYLISRCNLMITTDSVPLHIAAAVETPVLQLFGCTIPSKNSAWKAKGEVIMSDLDCQPCLYQMNFKSCTSNICMDKILPEMVLEKVFDWMPVEANAV